ncbi:MAG: spermidine synthase [Candidatus Aminicenantales bacterium]
MTANLPALVMGFLAAAFQIFLLREFSVHFFGNELTFGFVLASWLLWSGLGSLIAPRFRASRETLDRFYYISILLFVGSLVILRFSRFPLGIRPGELIGPAPALCFALGLCLLSAFPLGLLFVFNSGRAGGDVPRVYLFESLGAALGALVTDLGLVPFLSNWRGAAVAAAGSAAVVFWTFGRKKRPAWFLAVLGCLAALAVFDFPAQRIWWKPFRLVRSVDTPYGKLQAIRTGKQVSLYANGLPVFSYPDPVAFEGAVHFALLQNPEAGSVLLVGGGIGGGLEEVLKYRRAEVDYVELDPGIIRLSREVLPEKAGAAADDPRVRVHFEDGRAYLGRTKKIYDAILLNLPEPATAQINRFYTREFFDLVNSRLSENGVFSFVVPSSENYIGPELLRFLASLQATLSSVFPEVSIIPGDTNVFLASRSPLTTDPVILTRRMEEMGLRTTSINSALLRSRLNPLRTGYLRERIREAPALLNRDLAPAGYFFHSVLWSSPFKGVNAALLKTVSTVSGWWTIAVPVLAYALLLAFLFFRTRRAPFDQLIPLGTMGLTTIVIELAAVIAFQSYYGYVYGKIALLLAAFMAGLSAGAWAGIRKRRIVRADWIRVQAGFLPLIAIFALSLGRRPPEPTLFLLLLAAGALGGAFFVFTSRLLAETMPHFGLAYGTDLLGSFLGALAATAIIIPLAGILNLLCGLFLMNLLCLLYILLPAGRKTATEAGR